MIIDFIVLLTVIHVLLIVAQHTYLYQDHELKD